MKVKLSQVKLKLLGLSMIKILMLRYFKNFM